MSFTFQQGSTIVVKTPTRSREFLVGSITSSQTLLEDNRSVRTIHSGNNLPDVFSVSASNTSISFDVYIGAVSDTILFEWLGLEQVSPSKFKISATANLAVPAGIMIKSNGTNYFIDNCYIETVSVSMSKANPLMLRITASGGNLQVGTTMPLHASHTVQTSSEFIHGFLNQTKLGGFTCEITRELEWINQGSVHGALSGNTYVSSIAIVTSMNIAGSITEYKTSDIQINKYTNQEIEFVYADKFTAYLDKCNVFTRYDMSEVHKYIKDYKLLYTTTDSYFEFI